MEDSMKLTRSVLLSFLMLLAIDANPQEPKSQAPKERPRRTRWYSLAPAHLCLILTVPVLRPPSWLAIVPILSISDPALCVEPRPLFLTEASRNWNPAT